MEAWRIFGVAGVISAKEVGFSKAYLLNQTKINSTERLACLIKVKGSLGALKF